MPPVQLPAWRTVQSGQLLPQNGDPIMLRNTNGLDVAGFACPDGRELEESTGIVNGGQEFRHTRADHQRDALCFFPEPHVEGIHDIILALRDGVE